MAATQITGLYDLKRATKSSNKTMGNNTFLLFLIWEKFDMQQKTNQYNSLGNPEGEKTNH